jgi:ferredoxin
VPGLLKSDYHSKAPHPDDLARMLVDLLAVIKPGLAIMDGIVGMEGNGPSRGRPRNIGVLLAGADSVALDAVASAILGYQPQEIATTRIAAEEGLGKMNLADIRIMGVPLAEVIQKQVRLPSNALLRKIPRGLLRFLADKLLWSRPIVNKDICTQCGMCSRSCPVQAIKMEKLMPEINDETCINCLCCHELCPSGAIDIQTSWLLRAFSGGPR